MKLKNIFHAVALSIMICFFVHFSACTSKIAPKAAVPEEIKLKIIQRVEHYLQKNNHYLRSAKGYGKVKLKVKSKKENFDAVVIVDLNLVGVKASSPSLRFRFEILDDLGNTKSLIISNGEILSWKNFLKEEYHSTELSEKNLRKFLPLANSIEETIGLLVGRMPRCDLKQALVIPSSKSSSQGEGEYQNYQINFPQGEIIWNDQKQIIEFLALKSKNGKVAFQYEGKKFMQQVVTPTKETIIVIPSQIKLTDLKTKNEIEINYKVIEVGTELLFSPNLFE